MRTTWSRAVPALHQRVQPPQQHQRQRHPEQLVQLGRTPDAERRGAQQPADQQREGHRHQLARGRTRRDLPGGCRAAVPDVAQREPVRLQRVPGRCTGRTRSAHFRRFGRQFVLRPERRWIRDRGGGRRRVGRRRPARRPVRLDLPGRPFNADSSVSTRVVSVNDANAWAKSGVMVRNDMTKAGSSAGYAVVAVTARNGVVFEWDANGDGYLDTDARAGVDIYRPIWVKLTRSAPRSAPRTPTTAPTMSRSVSP